MPSSDPNEFATDADLVQLYPVFADSSWTVWVTDSADDTYTVTVLGTGYSYVASGDTIAAIRDALIAPMTPSAGLFTAAPNGTNAIGIAAVVPGTSLDVEVSPATLFATTQFSPTIRDCYLTLARCHFCADVWGCHLWRGHVLATAHMLKMWAQSKDAATHGPSGQITSMTQGPFSIGYGQSSTDSSSDSWWTSTPEGAQYLALRDSLGSVAFGITMGGTCQ